MRVEIEFDGQAHDAEAAVTQVVESLRGLFRESEKTGLSLNEIKITSAQASETAVNARRIQNSVSGIGQEARQANRELRDLKIGAVGSGLFAGILPGGARARTGAITLGAILGSAGLGPVAGGAAAGLAALPSLAATGGAALGVLIGAFSGLSKAISGNRQEFEKLDPTAQQFVQTIRSLEPWVEKLQNTARAGLFPGVEKGLRSALTPENAAAIQNATGGIAKALGDVAQQFGKSLGSPAFTQGFTTVMEHGAQNLRLWGDAATHLAGAFGKLTLAGQPLADWMSREVDIGSRLIDSWARQGMASGQLQHGLEGLKGQLIIVGNFGEELVKVLYELVRALTPLGDRILVDLTAALKNAAAWIERNRQGIADFTTGALDALEATLKIILPLAWDMAKALKGIVDAVGGWKVAFEIIIAGTLAAQVGKVAAAFYDLAKAEAVATGAAGGLYAKLALILGAAAAISGYKVGQMLFGGGGAQGGTAQANQSMGHFSHAWWMQHPNAWVDEKTGVIQDQKTGQVYFDPGATANIFKGAKGQATSATAEAARSWKLTYAQLEALWIKAGGKKSLAPTMAAIALAESGGTVGSLNDNPSTGDYSAGLWQINYFGGMRGPRTAQFGSPELLRTDPLANARAAVALAGGGSGLSNWSTYTNNAYLAYLKGGVAPSAGGPGSPFGKPPPFTATTAADLLPYQYRRAIAAAGITPGNKDDIVALKNAIGWFRANLKTFTGEDYINAANEMASLQSELKGLAPKLKKFKATVVGGAAGSIAYTSQPIGGFAVGGGVGGTGPLGLPKDVSGAYPFNFIPHAASGTVTFRSPSQSALIGARGQISDLLSLLYTPPKGAASDTLGVQTAQEQLKELRAKLGPEIKALQKELKSPWLDSASLSAIRAQLNQYKGTITDGVKAVTDAVAAQKQSFQAAWQGYAQAALDAIDQAEAKWVSPTRALLNQLQEQHNDQQLQDALTTAQQNLADALVGKPDDSAIVQNIKAILSRQNLANAIDAVQSAILGGPHVGINGTALLQQLNDAMTTAAVPDQKAVEQAQKDLAEAQYNIKVNGLEKQAAAEEQAHADEVQALRNHINDLAGQWESYFGTLKGNIADARDFWVKALNDMNLSGVASQVAQSVVGTAEEQSAAQAGYPIIQGQQWTPALEAAAQAVELAQVNAQQGGYGPHGAPQLHAAGGTFIARRPTMLTPYDMVGEAGPELVQITPMGKGGGDTVVNVHGNIPDDWIRVEVVKHADALSRAQGIHSDVRRRAGRY